jgi:hypothetical protein
VIYPVVVSASRLNELLGKEIARIRLFAYRQGVMHAIPLQIDQRDSNGNWVWSEIPWSDIFKQRRHIDSAGDDTDVQWELGRRYGRTYDDQDPGKEPVLDDNDVLVFMARDMGQHVANAPDWLANAATTLEIEITDPATGSRAWVYAAWYASDAPPGSPVRYVHYDADGRKVTSPVYAMIFSKEHVGVMQQLAIHGTELLDRTKFRGSLRLGGSRFGKTFGFSENDIDGYVYGYIDGPVRVVRGTVAALRFGVLLSSPTVLCDQFFYPYHSEIPVRLPANFFVHSASLLLAADYHHSPFRHAYTNTSSHAIQLRGMSSSQNLLEGASNVDWVALAGDGVSVISMLTVPEAIKPFIQVTPRLIYDQGLSDPPETYRGTEPQAGYLIETRPGFPSGEHLLVGTYLYLSRPFLERDAEQLLPLGMQKPDCRITKAAHRPTFGGAASMLRPDAFSRSK